MRVPVLLLPLLLTACASTAQPVPNTGFESAELSNAAENTTYEQLVAKVKRSASLEEFKALRKAYVKTDLYHPYSGRERALSNAMWEVADHSDWQACIDKANEVLAINYIDLSAHVGITFCAKEAGRQELSEYHQYVLDGLVDAIWATGDGRSEETAFFCTSVTELRDFIRLHGLEVVSQSLLEGEAGAFDLMTVKDPETEEEFDWYFDITAQLARGL